MSDASRPVHLLYVGSGRERVGLAREFASDEGFVVRTARTADEGLEQLRSHDIECLLSRYDLVRTDGLDLLKTVRVQYPELPFILVPEDGSEQLAARAIEAGVTSYLPDATDETHTRLRTRLERHVEQYRQRTTTEHEFVANLATDAYWVLDPETDELTLDGVQTFGYEAYEPHRSWWHDRLHPEDRTRILERDEALLADVPDAFDRRRDNRGWFTDEYRWRRADGTYADCLERGIVLFAGADPVKMIGTITDQTEQKERERDLLRQNERLEEVASVISHDLRNPLNVAATRLDLLAETCESEHIEPIEQAHDRMGRIIDNVLWLAQQGRKIGSTMPVDLAGAIEEAWLLVADDVSDAELVVDEQLPQYEPVADYDRLRQLLENLLRNAVEHGGEPITVRAGRLTGGFYIEDTGSGIPPGKRDSIFEAGYSTARSGTGLGLSIVEEVVDAHGWEIEVTEGTNGGARFEITGVECPVDACS